jgi:hypothetical protein
LAPLIGIPRRKLSEVNKKLGEKFEISETELLSTVEACSALLAEGQDLDTGEGATQVNQCCTACTNRGLQAQGFMDGGGAPEDLASSFVQANVGVVNLLGQASESEH